MDVLDLSNKHLEYFPRIWEIRNFDKNKIKHIKGWNNQFEELPDDLDLPNLETLDLVVNKFKIMPKLNYPYLKKLFMSDNELEFLPDLDLLNLEDLNLNANKLTKLSKFNLPNLKILDLGNNQLINLGELNLPKLETFHLYNNKLTKVSLNLPKLTLLDVSGNIIKSFTIIPCPGLVITF